MLVSVLICCEVVLLAEGLKRMLQECEAFRVLGLVHKEEDLAQSLELGPDVIVADKKLFAALLDFSTTHNARILLLDDGCGLCLNMDDLQELVSEGVAGILMKESDAALLCKAVAAVHAGELWIDRKTIQHSLHSRKKRSVVSLTQREEEILNRIRCGYSNKEISEKLCISEQTVKTHCHHLFQKYGVTSRLKLSLCDPPEP